MHLCKIWRFYSAVYFRWHFVTDIHTNVRSYAQTDEHTAAKQNIVHLSRNCVKTLRLLIFWTSRQIWNRYYRDVVINAKTSSYSWSSLIQMARLLKKGWTGYQLCQRKFCSNERQPYGTRWLGMYWYLSVRQDGETSVRLGTNESTSDVSSLNGSERRNGVGRKWGDYLTKGMPEREVAVRYEVFRNIFVPFGTIFYGRDGFGRIVLERIGTAGWGGAREVAEK